MPPKKKRIECARCGTVRNVRGRDKGCKVCTHRKVVSMKEILASAWFNERPHAIQVAVKTWPPGWYKMKRGQEVRLYSYEENEKGQCKTCKVIVETGWNVGAMVFGVPLTDLAERLVVPS